MYKLYFVALSFFVIQLVSAQIPNAGFENWTSGNPDGWFATNIVVTTVTQSTLARTGSYALRGEATTFYTTVIAPAIQSGSDAEGFAYTQRPVSITGYYQFYPASSSGDRFYVDAGLYKGSADGGTPVAIGAVAISSTASSYTQFTATFNYLTSDTPDTCVIQISIVGPSSTSSTPHAGSYYLLDDLSFSGTVNVEKQLSAVPQAACLHQNYPNPFNPSTTITYRLANASTVKLRVYNLLGKEVAQLADGFQSAGIHTVHFHSEGMASGVYFYKIEAGGYIAMKQMLLLK